MRRHIDNDGNGVPHFSIDLLGTLFPFASILFAIPMRARGEIAALRANMKAREWLAGLTCH